jgi:alpha-tubulin suppressor-like RCC1 family protein
MFTGCSGLESVVFSSGSTGVRNGMFVSCSNLTSVSLPSSLTSIGNYGFSQCNSLAEIDLTYIKSIGDNAFADCSNISTLIIEDQCTSIGASAFANCSSVSMIRFVGNYPTIGTNAFSGLASDAVIYFNPEKTGWTNYATINGVSTIALVYISGTFTQQQTLTANTNLVESGVVPNGTVFTYQWYEDSSPISGATASTLVLKYDQVDKTIHVVVSYNINGALTTLTSISSAAVDAFNNSPTGTVSISGSNTPSSVLTATNTIADVDGLGTFYYQWYRNTTSSNVGGTAITDATTTTYTLSGIDANAYIYVKLYYTDNYGTPEIVYSSPTVQIVGLPPSDVTATATSATTASISFTPSENVTSYTVTSSPGGITRSGTSSPIVVSGLTANTAYTFTITSAYGSYTTPSSEGSNSVKTFIAAPTNVVATATSFSTATVTFTEPAGGSANAITYTLSGGGSYSLSGTTFTVTGLTANTAYTFTVNATTTANTTSATSSEITTETTTEGAIFSAPSALHSLALKSDKTIYGCGSNDSLQLAMINSIVSMINTTGKTPVSIAAGNNHTIVLMSDGSIYGCGQNSGRLGDGTNINRLTLTLMTNTTGKTPQSIYCGGSHTMVLMSDGSIYGCGINQFGQLGDGTSTNRTTLTLMTNTTGKTPQSISCGTNYTMVLMSDGSIYGCGVNVLGQLGDGATTSGLTPQTTLIQLTNNTGKTPQSISCGLNHTMILMSDGSIYGCGGNYSGQFGDGTTTNTSTLTLMTNSTGKTPQSIFCGNTHTMVLMSDGSIYGCGSNDGGQLGDGTTTNRSTLTLMTNSTGKTPQSISCGNGHTMVLMSDKSIYGCGFNINIQLGDGTTTNRSTLTLMTNNTGKTPQYISCSETHTMIFMDDGSIYGNGSNSFGELGDGTTAGKQTFNLINNTTGKTPQSISCGNYHTMVLMIDASIYGCGANSGGQLGDGTTTNTSTLTLMSNSTGKTPVYISCGSNYTIVLMSDASIYGCGSNQFGQFGDGTTTFQQTTLTQMTNTTGKTPISISCGGVHTMVLMSDGSIYGCGSNGSGQLGDGTTTIKTTLTQMTNSTGKTPVSISCGLTHTMVLMSDGSIYGCGINSNGQLGNGTTTFQHTTLTQMTNTTGKTPQSISCGNGHTIVLMSDGSIYGCGFNRIGQLGDGTTTNRTTLTLMTNSTGKTPQSISCGNDHTMVLMNDGYIYACGSNSRGQLGDGTSTNRITLTRMTVGDGITPITL